MSEFTISGEFAGGVRLGNNAFFPTIADFNGDGWLEPLGFINTGDGTLVRTSFDTINTVLAQYPNRVDRDNRVFDIDGDGNLDILWNVYSDPGDTDSFTLIFHGDGSGNFGRVEERRDITGFGETIVVADFNNDGWSDAYLPAYTHVEGTDSGYLLLNDNGTLGPNVAQEWGAGLSGLSVFYRVEGAQAADVNFDGKIDMYVGSHLFVNQGDHFEAKALDPFVFDEGANLIDYDNDGDFDLVLRPEDEGPELFENVDGTFQSRGNLTGSEVISGFGVNVADVDNNGWMDIVLGGPGSLTVMFNFGGTFTRSDIPVDAGSGEALALADIDNDGRLDIISRAGGQLFYLQNQLNVGQSLSLSVLGPNGEQNQHGRSVTFTPRDGSELVMARVVDGGSGYLSQGQYDLLVGLPETGAYDVTVFFAAGPLSFVSSAGQKIAAFADGRVAITGSELADVMGGSTGADSLAGQGGDDRIIGSLGNDELHGGDGVDTIDWTGATAGVGVDLSSGRIDYAGSVQTIDGVENVLGTAYADVLNGNASANLLDGGGGDDILSSLGAGDTLVGGNGNDVYIVTRDAATLIEEPNGGVDTVRTDLATFALPANIERLEGISPDGQTLVGNELANYISGGASADVFRGAGGDDTYLVDIGDIVEESADGGVDEVRTALSVYTLPANVEKLTGISDDGQHLIGNDAANIFAGGAGADLFAGGLGNDVYFAGVGDLISEAADEGIDEVRTQLSSYVLPENVEWLTGLAATSQSLVGNQSNNVFRGGSANDVFEGLDGDDTYFVGAGDVVIESPSGGTDEVWTDLDIYTLSDNVEKLIGLGAKGQKLIGNAGDNMIVGGAGADTMIGGTGNDIYVVNSVLDMAQEKAGAGYDIVQAAVSYGLYVGTAIEALQALDPASTVALNLSGNEFAQTITGNAGQNVLAGGGGGDVLIGLAGDDTYAIDDARDAVIEAPGEGFDRVATFVSYRLAAGVSVELLYARDIASTAAISLTGNAFAQSIYGNAGDNILDGGGGGDTLAGFGGNDTYVISDARDVVAEAEGGGYDRVATFISYNLTDGASVEYLYARDITSTAAISLTGNALAQSIYGNAGDNVLNGGGGADVLAGFGGNDVYWVDSADDVVIEAVGNGTDTVRASASFAFQPGTEIEILAAFDPSGTAAINLSGNKFAQTITGNAGQNVLAGGGGGDVLIGLAGDDTYAIDDARDAVIEAPGEGFDRVATFVSYRLAAGVSVELLYARDIASTAAISLTGNAFAQSIYGNAGDNILDGGGGGDTLAGFGGNDTYVISDARDVVAEAEGGGYDRVATFISYNLTDGASVEYLYARDITSTAAISLTGNALAQSIYGNAGDNVLNGGGGADVLAGFGGNDVFAFTAPLKPGDITRILDFAVGTDKIALDANVFGLSQTGNFSASLFGLGTEASNATQRILYDAASGQLLYDADGLGGQEAQGFAILSPNLNISALDFMVLG